MTTPLSRASLSPIELQILPYLSLSFDQLIKKTGLESVAVLRGLKLLEAKQALTLTSKRTTLVDLGVNGILYHKKGLPERRVLDALQTKRKLPLEAIATTAGISEHECKVALGILRQKKLIAIHNNMVLLEAPASSLAHHSPEEQVLALLPSDLTNIPAPLRETLTALQKRRDMITAHEHTSYTYKLTQAGEQLLASQPSNESYLEEVTPALIRDWSTNKPFRQYNLQLPVPKLIGAQRHFVQQAVDYACTVWTQLGFKEMSGSMIDSSFWVFDALFTPQDHPARDMQDTFFVPKNASLPDAQLIARVKQAHEGGLVGSKGWQYTWQPQPSQKMLLRTHTTSLSARALASLKQSDMPAKLFAIGKVFRNETVDWSHGFEFYQTEGIVVAEGVTLAHLLGYLKTFYHKMGYTKVRFVPSFYAYTTPSVEIQVWHPERNVWFELGGAGIFRPEVTAALLGKPIPVLAWGQGFDRIILEASRIKDLRQLYDNDLKRLREMPLWKVH